MINEQALNILYSGYDSSELIEFQLVTYDLWGSDEHGWEVNQKFATNDIIRIHPDMSDEEIVEVMIANGIANTNCSGKINIDGDCDFTLYAEWKVTAKPAFELRRVA